MPNSTWTDESSFSQRQKDRTPTTWRRRAGAFTLTVHRHIHYAPTDWLFTCEPIAKCRVLNAATTAAQARKEADEIFTIMLTQALKEHGK